MPIEKRNLDLSSKVCLIIGNLKENTSISHSIANKLSDAGAKVYITESKQDHLRKEWKKLTTKPNNKNIVALEGKLLVFANNITDNHLIFYQFILT